MEKEEVVEMVGEGRIEEGSVVGDNRKRFIEECF